MEIYEYGNKDASIVLVQLVDGHMLGAIQEEIELINARTDADYSLVVFNVNNWNSDLSPWPSPAVFGKDDFAGNAKDTLSVIVDYCKDRNKTYYIGGYSLAGLFALWVSYQTDIFEGVAAASPSMWYPDFDSYMKKHTIKSKRVYLSLGDKEEKTKNPVMATVGDRIREAYEYLKAEGIDCILEWNEGNHFKDFSLRMSKAFEWILRS